MSVISITEQLDEARRLLIRVEERERTGPALGAALLAAVTALLLAGAVILGPGVEAAPSAESTAEAR